MQLSKIISAVGSPVPARLPAFLAFIAGLEDAELVDPRARGGLHPLVIPVAKTDQGITIGLLRWPTATDNFPLPVVRVGNVGMSLWAASIDQLLHSELATRDADGEDLAGLSAAANREELLYKAGTLAESGLPLKAYLLLRVAGLPHLYEELALKHKAKGDHTSAAVTAERAGVASKGWGRPQAFLSRLLEEQGMPDSGREAARAALSLPIWTLGAPFEEIALRAGWKAPITAQPYRTLAELPDKPILDRAAHWMDVWAIEEGDWDALRPKLAELYSEAGLPHIAAFVGG
ncbi:MAG: hypothetical protein ACI9VR_002159 [Cognaticolwellia sp.]|jgi:hypothetical protein